MSTGVFASERNLSKMFQYKMRRFLSLRSRRLEVVGTRKNGRARRTHLIPCVSPSRTPVLSFTHYFQAPTTQARDFFPILPFLLPEQLGTKTKRGNYSTILIKNGKLIKLPSSKRFGRRARVDLEHCAYPQNISSHAQGVQTNLRPSRRVQRERKPPRKVTLVFGETGAPVKSSVLLLETCRF